jgi:hypothetical protein
VDARVVRRATPVFVQSQIIKLTVVLGVHFGSLQGGGV